MVQDYDSPWKDALGIFFEPAIEFFFPTLHEAVDWGKGIVFLDKEFSSIVRKSHRGTVLADKLAQVFLKMGRRVRVYVHLEVQAKSEGGFTRRMFVYHYRIVDLHGDEVISLAILADESQNWRPTEYVQERFGTSLRFAFPIVKLLDWADRTEELLASDNPIAMVVLAHLQSQATRNDLDARYSSKTRLVRNLYERGWSPETVRQLFRLIDWLMTLPPELEEKLQTDLTTYEEEKKMPFVTSIERMAIERGRREAEAAAKVELEAARNAEKAARDAEKAAKAKAQASHQEAAEALHEGLTLALELKYGKPGIAFAKKLKKVKDLTVLRDVQRGIRTAKTVDELQPIVK